MESDVYPGLHLAKPSLLPESGEALCAQNPSSDSEGGGWEGQAQGAGWARPTCSVKPEAPQAAPPPPAPAWHLPIPAFC